MFVRVWYLSTQWSCGGHKIYCRIKLNNNAVFVKVWYLSTQWSCGGHKIYCRIKLNNNAVFVKVWYLSTQWSCGGHKICCRIKLNNNRNTVCAIVSIKLPQIFVSCLRMWSQKFKNGHGW